MNRHDELLALALKHVPRGMKLMLDNEGQLRRDTSTSWEIRYRRGDYFCRLNVGENVGEDYRSMNAVEDELVRLKRRAEDAILDMLAEEAADTGENQMSSETQWSSAMAYEWDEEIPQPKPPTRRCKLIVEAYEVDDSISTRMTTLADIARALGVDLKALEGFIKHKHIQDMAARGPVDQHKALLLLNQNYSHGGSK